MRPITKTQFSKERQVSRARVYQWIEDGRVQALEDGKIDADAAHATLDAALDQTKGVRREGNITSTAPEANGAAQPELPIADKDKPTAARPGADKSYWDDKAREQKAVATMAEMKALKEAGALVSAAGVKKEATSVARSLRNALQAIPDRTAPVLASMTSPSAIHKYLTDEQNRVVDEFCAGLEQRAADVAGAEQPEPALP